MAFAEYLPLEWRHNGRNGVSNLHPNHCLLDRLFWRRSKKTTKLRVTGLCAGKSPVTGELSAQMASDAENVSIWWRQYMFHCEGTNYLRWDSPYKVGLYNTKPTIEAKKIKQSKED